MFFLNIPVHFVHVHVKLRNTSITGKCCYTDYLYMTIKHLSTGHYSLALLIRKPTFSILPSGRLPCRSVVACFPYNPVSWQSCTVSVQPHIAASCPISNRVHSNDEKERRRSRECCAVTLFCCHEPDPSRTVQANELERTSAIQDIIFLTKFSARIESSRKSDRWLVFETLY